MGHWKSRRRFTDHITEKISLSAFLTNICKKKLCNVNGEKCVKCTLFMRITSKVQNPLSDAQIGMYWRTRVHTAVQNCPYASQRIIGIRLKPQLDHFGHYGYSLPCLLPPLWDQETKAFL